MTLANSNTIIKYGNVDAYEALITATGNDTTANADSDVIPNQDLNVRDIHIGMKATNQTGSSPTLTAKLLGAFQAAGPYFIVQTQMDQDDVGTLGDVDSAALDISTASTTNVAEGICGSQFGLKTYPPYLKVRITVGGSATPGWTGVAYASVKRGD